MSLSYLRGGTGIPIVFLHAFPLSKEMWAHQMTGFSRNFQPVAPDLPGFGKSPLEGNKTNMGRSAEAVHELLEAVVPGEPVILCGLSMGGYVALEFMRRWSARVRGLVLACTRASADAPEARVNRLKLIDEIKKRGPEALTEAMEPRLLGATARAARPDLVREVREAILKTSPESAAAALAGMADRNDCTDLLPAISCPTLVLAGEEDTLIRKEESERMKDGLVKGRLVTLPKAGHLANLEAPQAFHEAVLHFLKSKVL